VSAGCQIGLIIQHRCGRFQHGAINQKLRLLLCDQRFNLTTQLLIPGAGLSEEGVAPARFAIEERIIELSALSGSTKFTPMRSWLQDVFLHRHDVQRQKKRARRPCRPGS
jgi:hypothetical protein